MAKRKRKNPAEIVAGEAAKGAIKRLKAPRRRAAPKAKRTAAPRRATMVANPARRKRRPARRVASVMRSNPRSNGSLGTDLVEDVVPAFAGYGATRIVARIIYSVIIKKKPNLAKHAAAVATIASAVAAWYLSHRVKRLERHHNSIVAGAGIAVIQTLVQTYIQKYGWLVSDYDANAVVSVPTQQIPTGLNGSTRIPRSRVVTVGGKRFALPEPRGGAESYNVPDQGQQGVGADSLEDVATPDGGAQEDLGILGGGGMFAGDDSDIDQMIAEAQNHQVN